MSITPVQLGTPRLPKEGLRLGTVRHLPRGVRKDRYAADNWFDVWLPTLSPTAPLVKAARASLGDQKAWRRFVAKYRAEMRRPEPARALDLLAALSRVTNLSVGCYCDDPRFCHRSILIELLVERGAIVRRR
jgi:uncharacterized protein YeaO (DUF488 family)